MCGSSPLETWGKTIVTDWAQGMQRKSVGIYSILCLAQKQYKAMHLEHITLCRTARKPGGRRA